MMLVLRRVWIQMTSDRKRFGVLCGMVLVGLLLWSRLIIVSNLPRTAVAGEDDAATSAAGATHAGPGKSGTSDNHGAAVVAVMMSRIPGRDPFQLNASQFPKPAQLTAITPDQGKSPSQSAENPEEAEARINAYLKALVDGLKLKAVMEGISMAVIDGEMYRVGQSIPVKAQGKETVNFTLTAVKERSATLECKGHSFTLELDDPLKSKKP